MKILLMLSSIAMGGTERNIVSVAPYFKKAGVDVMLCTLNKRRDSPLAEVFSSTGIERFDLGAKRMTDFRALRKLAILLREKKIDLVHAEDQDTIIYSGLARRLFNVPALMTRHVLQEPAHSWKTAMRSKMVFWSARYGVNRVITVSEVVRQHFSKQAGVPLKRIHTIYNGIEIEKFDIGKSQRELRTELGWEVGCPIAIFISVLRPGKGFEVLFEAIPKIRKTLPGFQLKLVGSGELEAELRRQAAPLGDAVEFLGQRMDIPQLLGASDVLIQSSWSEALPTVLIEAGAAAIPVVATNVGGTAEIVEDARSGYVIPAGDSEMLANRTIEILLSPDLKHRMGRHAREHVSKTFSLEKQARETIALYESVISGAS